MGIPVHMFPSSVIPEASVIIDALIGYHLDGALRGEFADVVQAMYAASGEVVAYDIPTGVYPDSAECEGV